MNLKIIPISYDLKKISTRVPYNNIDSSKPSTWVLGLLCNSTFLPLYMHVEGCKKDSFKMVLPRNPVLCKIQTGRYANFILTYGHTNTKTVT